MFPNISNKSVYIIFIISINIVSMVCYYQPIKISYVENKPKYYLYTEYLDEKIEYFDKLNYEEFFDSVFNPEHKFSHLFDNKQQMKLEIENFCNDDNKYIPYHKYKRIYQIMSLGRHVRKFRKCIKSDNDKTFNSIQIGYTNALPGTSSDITASKLNNLLTVEQKNELQHCLNEFTEPIKKIFDDLGEIGFSFNKKSIGIHVDYLLHIVTNNDDAYFTDNNNELISFQYFYKEITQYKNADAYVKNVTVYTEDEKISCRKYYETNTIDYYVPMPEIFEGFDNYTGFIIQSEIRIKYLLSLEGPLMNNKKLYETYLANPITLNDYNNLRQPIPLYYETMYSIYSLRLQKLGYLPLHEKTWYAEMGKLLWNPSWTATCSKAGLKSFIDEIMLIEENENYNY